MYNRKPMVKKKQGVDHEVDPNMRFSKIMEDVEQFGKQFGSHYVFFFSCEFSTQTWMGGFRFSA